MTKSHGTINVNINKQSQPYSKQEMTQQNLLYQHVALAAI